MLEAKSAELTGLQVVLSVRSFTFFPNHILKTNDKLWRAPALIFACDILA
jgi:hypothetical protein